MIKIHWFAYFRMFLIGFVAASLLERAGYTEGVVLLVMFGIGLFYPEIVVSYIQVPKDDTKN